MKLGYDNISINGGVQVKRSEPLRPLHSERTRREGGFFFILQKRSKNETIQYIDTSIRRI